MTKTVAKRESKKLADRRKIYPQRVIDELLAENASLKKKLAAVPGRLNELEAMFGDSLPQSPDLERDTLGAILLGDMKYVGIAFAKLVPGDFYVEWNRAAFLELRAGWQQGVPFDVPSLLLAWLKDSGVLERLARTWPNAQPLVDLIAGVEGGVANGLPYCCAHLRLLHCRRAMLLTSWRAAASAANATDVASWLEEVRSDLSSLHELSR